MSRFVDDAVTQLAPAGGLQMPRVVDPGRSRSDTIFRNGTRTVSGLVLVIFGAIGLFLFFQMVPVFRHYGIKFFTSSGFNPPRDQIGIASTLLGTVLIAAVALVIAFPMALATALYISEFAPARLKALLVGLIDLMAAVPSVIYGLWGALALQPHAKYVARWLAQHFGWIPLFHVRTDPNAASWAQTNFVGSAFIAGICVAMMVLPIACAIMRGVFSSAPIGEREAAYALGATRWWMIRTVVMPFGRGGIIGGTMLGLGRALGETVAVLLILEFATQPNWSIIQGGTSSISYLIANGFGDASGYILKGLLAAGLVLFVLTLAVNTVAAVFVGRSRSGSAI